MIFTELKTPSIHRPYIFMNVVVSCMDKKGNRWTYEVPGECYSEFVSGPDRYQLADWVAEQQNTAAWVGLISCAHVQ